MGLPVIAYLVDNAYGQAQDITRDGWTSYYAEMLGYTPTGDGSTFYKKYQ